MIEPGESGAVIRLHVPGGKYPEIWVASNLNVGCWYPSQETYLTTDAPAFLKKHNDGPTFHDLSRRGRPELLTATNAEAYEEGWRAGCEASKQAADELVWQCPGPGGPQ